MIATVSRSSRIEPPLVRTFGIEKKVYESLAKDYNKLLDKGDDDSDEILGSIVDKLSPERLLAIAMSTPGHMPEEKFESKDDAFEFFKRYALKLPEWEVLKGIADSGKWWEEELRLEEMERKEREDDEEKVETGRVGRRGRGEDEGGRWISGPDSRRKRFKPAGEKNVCLTAEQFQQLIERYLSLTFAYTNTCIHLASFVLVFVVLVFFFACGGPSFVP